MNVRRHISLIILCLAGCQGPTRLAAHWEVGQLTADGSTVFGSTLDGIRSVGRDGSRGTDFVQNAADAIRNTGKTAVSHLRWKDENALSDSESAH